MKMNVSFLNVYPEIYRGDKIIKRVSKRTFTWKIEHYKVYKKREVTRTVLIIFKERK
jgi:hypothetical protein